MTMINTPIVLICFNRPIETAKIFNKIKLIKPKKLFLIMDGPRVGEHEDKINCLLIEFHYIDINIDLIEKFIISSNDLKLVHIHGNNYAGNNNNGDPNLIELTFINTKIIDVELKKTNKSYPVNTLDYKNHQKKGDFILEFEDDIKIS